MCAWAWLFVRLPVEVDTIVVMLAYEVTSDERINAVDDLSCGLLVPSSLDDVIGSVEVPGDIGLIDDVTGQVLSLSLVT